MPTSTPRRALVTGASSGIGAATARLLASAGYRVALLARDESKLRGLADELGAERALVLPCDLRDPAALERAFARLKALRGHPSRNARNALKVLLKFQMLDRERVELPVLYDALCGARFIENAAGLMHMSVPDALDWAIRELVKQSQLARDGDTLLNHEPSGAASA